MSVIIRGVDIPKNCSECPCCRHDSLDGIHMYQCNVKIITFGEFDSWIFKKRPNWCPLHPLPEKHGRIVDVGPLEVVAYSLSDHKGESFNDGVEFILEKLDALPTIVEAEGE